LSFLEQRGIQMIVWVISKFALPMIKKMTALALLTLARALSVHLDLLVYTIEEIVTP
jgi:hypothetical protein